MSYRCNCPTVFCSECFASRNRPQFLYGSATISALLPHYPIYAYIYTFTGGRWRRCLPQIILLLFCSFFLLNLLLHRNWDVLLTIKKYMFQRLISDNGRAWHPGVSFTSVVDHSFLELDSTPSSQEQPKPSPSQSNQPGRLHSCKETEMTNCLTSDPLPQPWVHLWRWDHR